MDGTVVHLCKDTPFPVGLTWRLLQGSRFFFEKQTQRDAEEFLIVTFTLLRVQDAINRARKMMERVTILNERHLPAGTPNLNNT